MTNVLDTLKAARDKLADPKHWTRGELARDKGGWPVPPQDPQACEWCIVGALAAVSPNGACRRQAMEALSAGFSPAFRSSLSFFNDRTSHSEVLKLFDKAIAKEGK